MSRIKQFFGIKDTTALTPVKDNNLSSRGYGSLAGGGGVRNDTTGLGVSGLDKSEDTFFVATRLIDRMSLETVYNESWAAAKFINIPVDDMFIRWRKFTDMSERGVDVMTQQEKKHKVRERLARAMKAGRLYGTGLLVLMTKEAPLDFPLNVNRIRPGDLTNILVVDRFDASIYTRDTDPFSENFGKPSMYHINIKGGGTILVHASRVLRFDGKTPLSSTGWDTYDQDWGVSEIIPVMTSIKQDSVVASGVAHLTQEASIPVVNIENFQEALEGECDAANGVTNSDADTTLSQLANTFTSTKSIFRTVFLGANDKFERQHVNFANIPDLMDRYAKRLSAAADIPATRFWGQSPVGMNATGDSDLENYAAHVASMQNVKLPGPLELLDTVLAKDAGLKEVISYEFLSLMDISEKEQADIAKTKVEAAVLAVGGPILDEEEARKMLDGDACIGNIEVDAFEAAVEEEEGV